MAALLLACLLWLLPKPETFFRQFRLRFIIISGSDSENTDTDVQFFKGLLSTLPSTDETNTQPEQNTNSELMKLLQEENQELKSEIEKLKPNKGIPEQLFTGSIVPSLTNLVPAK